MIATIERKFGDSMRPGEMTNSTPSRKAKASIAKASMARGSLRDASSSKASSPRGGRKAAAPQPTRAIAASDFTDDPIYRRIRDAVMAGHLLPGTKLAEEPLAAAFGTNRLRIREVLRLLSFAGIVEIIPNRGAFIAKPDRREAMDTYQARRLVEAEIVRLACQNLSRSSLAQLRGHVARQREAELAGDRALFIRLIGEFHLVLAEVAGNKVLASFVSQLVARTSLIIMLYERPSHVGCAVDEHAALIDMIAKGNAAGAVAAMNHHLSAIEERLKVEEPPERAGVDFRRLFGALD